MKAIQLNDGKLEWQTSESLGQPGPGEVLINNAASAVNRADLAQAAGAYPPPPGASPILGLECAGEVAAVGEGVNRVAPGDRVCALLSGGGYAEQVLAPAGQVLPVPDGFTDVQAAALPEVFATAYLNLFIEARLVPGERAVLHAGASGVGTAGVQMCKAFGNPVFVTAGSADKIARCVDLGLMGGVQAELNLGLMMMKRQRVIGSTLRARTVPAKAAVMDALYERVWPLLESGEIKPIIEAEVPLPEAARAHELIAGNDTVGKVILTL